MKQGCYLDHWLFEAVACHMLFTQARRMKVIANVLSTLRSNPWLCKRGGIPASLQSCGFCNWKPIDWEKDVKGGVVREYIFFCTAPGLFDFNCLNVVNGCDNIHHEGLKGP